MERHGRAEYAVKVGVGAGDILTLALRFHDSHGMAIVDDRIYAI